jgi:hypothetical protein
MQITIPIYFEFEGDWFIKLPSVGNSVGPFASKEDAEEWYRVQTTVRCKDCEE